MTAQPRLSRAAVLLFASALLVTLGELGWWTWLNLRNAAGERRDHLERIERDVRLAAGLQALLQADGGALGLGPAEAEARAQKLLEPLFPALSLAHGQIFAAQVGVALAIEQRFVTRVRMFVAEGLVFAVLLLLGGSMVVRSLRHELAIVRQISNFVAAMTHELKSPLASLRLWVETLERRPLAGEQARVAFPIMRADIDRLERLVNNVLSAARLENRSSEAKQSELMSRPLEMKPACEALAAAFVGQAARKGLTLQVKAPTHPLLLVAMEPPALALVVNNLLDNAIKYGGTKNPIEFSLAAEGEGVVIAVRDFGLGLAPGEEKRIFDKFYRVGDEMVRQSQGTGLGLFLVRAVVEEHGGTVMARSEGLGRGTTFFVRLPRAKPQASQAAEGPGQ